MRGFHIYGIFLIFGLYISNGAIRSGWEIPEDTPGGKTLRKYFELETARLESRSLAEIETPLDWKAQRSERVLQMQKMLGMPPMENRPPLKAKVTGTIKSDDFIVEKLHFQSLPGLYVTGNLYLPSVRAKKLPGVLYVCGHGRVKKNGVSYGNKTHYQHHGAWFARNGYVCLTIDTIQLGEIEGYHHGTHSGKMLWWMSRGYTPAGVEAWNGIRAIDYLLTRPEVDGSRIGVTGRSGGGAYSWWITALDERVKVSVPVAGITSLRNHIIDGCIEGHCDCMFMVNSSQWDFAEVAALVAPRKLLISNTDNDIIFPLDGVVDVYNKTRRIYKLLGVENNIGLHVTDGGHSDTQPLRMGAFHWFNKHLKGESSLVKTTAEKFFEPENLKVFTELPQDEITSTIHDSFVPVASAPELPNNSAAWKLRGDQLLTKLRATTFAGWPEEDSIDPAPKLYKNSVFDGVRFQQYSFTSQEPYQLQLFLMHRDGLELEDLDLVVLNVLDETSWREFLAWAKVGFEKTLASNETKTLDKAGWNEQRKMLNNFNWGMAYVAPRGVGPTRFPIESHKGIQIQRRFYLLGQTLEGMQTWDVRQASRALSVLHGMKKVQRWMQADGHSAGLALYASLYEEGIHRLDLYNLPASHQTGPQYLHILRYLDIPETVAHAATRSQVRIYTRDTKGWEFPSKVGKNLGWGSRQFKVQVLND